MTLGSELLERDLELARLAAAIDGACGGEGAVVLIEGPAGIGKTALLRATTRLADGRMSPLSARATEFEREFPFGVVRQLLEPPLRSAGASRRVELLQGAAAHAAPVLGPAEPGAAAGLDKGFVTLNGLYWLVAGLAEHEPLLLVLDDAHWADSDSLRFLTFLAPRLTELPVLLLLAARAGELRPAKELAATASDPAAAAVVPAPLSERASAALVGARFGENVHPEFARACHTATGGNPFYLHALIDELARDHVSPSPKAAERVLQLGPHAVSQVIVARLARLAPVAAPLARAIAVLGDDADLEDAARLAELEPDKARAVLTELTDAAILERAEPLRFSHPIIRNAVYRDIGHSERAALHRRAVELLSGPGGARDRIPGHLLAVPPVGDSWVVKTLREAAENAVARGAVDSAVAYLRRALDEPPPESDRAGVLLELGRAEASALDPAGLEHLEAAANGAQDPSRRAAALGTLAFFRFGTGDAAGAATIARQALESIPPGAGGQPEAMLLLGYGLPARVVPELVDEARALLESPRTGPHGEPTPAEIVRLVLLSLDDVLLGQLEAGVQSLRRAGDLREQIGGIEAAPVSLGSLFSLLGRHHEAEEETERALEHARHTGSQVGMLLALEGRAHLRWRSGDLAGTIADAETEIRLSEEVGPEGEWDPATMPVRAIRAVCLLERGDPRAAARALDLPDGLEARLEHTWGWLWLPYARARLLLARARWAEAHEQARTAQHRLAAIQAPSPDYLPWRSLAARALVGLGKRDQALELAREEIALSRATGSARATAVSLATLGSIRDGNEGIEALREAVELLEESPARLAHARALVDLGAAIRRAGRRAEARELLSAGMDLARLCGAAPLVERAYTELRAAGARPRKPAYAGVEALTPSELRVARMASEGMANREIAQRLFVTVKTVEFHLGQTYRKLEISSREELRGALRGRGGPTDHLSP